jgi:uroporphyrinogen-III decarboxylase
MPHPFSPVPNDADKKQVWDAYYARHPIRVPLRWNVNPRIVILNPSLNPEGWTFEHYVNDPDIHIRSYIRFQEYCATELSRYSDASSALPERWGAPGDVQNTYDAAYFGGTLTFREGQVPGVESFLTEADFDGFLKRDFSDVLANPFVKNRMAFREALAKAAQNVSYLGRPVQVSPFTLGFDGPVTAAAAIFGTDFFILLGEDPEKASRLLGKITKDVIHRNRVLRRLAGVPEKVGGGYLADDSIQLIGLEMFEKWILPWHAFYLSEMFTSTPADRNRGMHLCGDATRHFKTISDQLGVISFDTGFPVDHGWLRKELGPDIEISGGPQVSLLQSGSPDACAAEARRILQSGIMAGGRFILQEANNLPPGVPLENLASVYATCREFGLYPKAS